MTRLAEAWSPLGSARKPPSEQKQDWYDAKAILKSHEAIAAFRDDRGSAQGACCDSSAS